MISLKPINATDLKRRLDAGDAVLIDVRESDEHAREHILGARLAPLSPIDAHDFDRDHGKAAVFHCRSGMRTQANAAKLLARGFREGVLSRWRNRSVEGRRPARSRHRKAPLEIMRQVQITAGLLILTGIVLGWTVNPIFYALSAFVGAGLTFAGATGWCGMAMLLKTMPWNRTSLSA